mgnify:CR=1 FL=1
MGSITFNTTNREAVCTVVVVAISIATVEVTVTSVRTINITRPVVTVTRLIVKRSIAVVTVTSCRTKKHKLYILVA